MDALIIAAGFGSRLASLSPSKPLTPVAGVPLIELGIRQAISAGVTRVVVATGHEAERLEQFLAALSQRIAIPIEPVRLEDWSRPNGWSVMAGADRISGNYLLLMADHMFEAELLQRVLAAGRDDRGVTLAIDTWIDNPLVDPDDATWVERGADGRIKAIGKTIAKYDCVDCGAFLASPELAMAIGMSIQQGAAGSLSEGMRVLAQQGRAGTVDVTGLWWMDVDDPKAHAEAERLAPTRLGPAYQAAGVS